MKVFAAGIFESKLEKVEPKSKREILDFVDTISDFKTINDVLKLSQEIDNIHFFKLSVFRIFFTYTEDKVVLYDFVQKKSTDQEVAEEVLIRYIQRSRDAQNVEVLERLTDENNWIFKIGFQSEKGYYKGKWGINKESGMVTNQLDRNMKEIILFVIENSDFYEYSIANEELRTNINKLHIDYNKVDGFTSAAFGRYYENIIEMLTDKIIRELCELGYGRYRVVRSTDNIEVDAGNFNCNG